MTEWLIRILIFLIGFVVGSLSIIGIIVWAINAIDKASDLCAPIRTMNSKASAFNIDDL